jgi:hypothetical protein
MKRSSRPRTTVELSKSFHHQLNMYTLAATAAGVGVLTLVQPANARIVYTHIHHVIGKNGYYSTGRIRATLVPRYWSCHAFLPL